AAGDAVLVELAARMQRHVGPGDVVARTGGDEFVLVVSDASVRARAERLARTLRHELVQPVATCFGEHQVGVSVGLAVRPTPAGVSRLLREADTAMYADKAARRACSR
ncbi:MAG TPA: GGDEF domain-containing protein, partial [Angustibacter sp.]|nr:GGDEF domain-containing protein [Angustibacter sp.]